MNIGEKIQVCRKNKKMSQEELGERLLVSRQTISLWETGQTLPSIDNLIRLREIFGMSLDSILCDEQEITVDPDEELSYEFTPEENFRIQKAVTSKGKRKIVNLLTAILCLIALALLAGTQAFALGFICAVAFTLVVFLLVLKRNLNATKKTYFKYGNRTLRYELYENHMLFKKLSDSDTLETVKIYYHEIEKIYDMDEFLVISFKNRLYPLKKEETPSESRIFILKRPDMTYSAEGTRAAKRTSASIALISASILSIPAALATIDRVVPDVSRFVDYSWIFLLFIPIPIALSVYGVVLQAQKRSGIMNILIGLVVLVILCLYGSFSILL